MHYLKGQKQAASDLGLLRDASQLTTFNKLEKLLTPELPKHDENKAREALKTIQNEARTLKRRYNVSPILVGSMPLKLNIPGEADADFFIRLKSKQKFENLAQRLERGGYAPSRFNSPEDTNRIFHKPISSTNPLPIDIAVAYGPDADRYRKSVDTRMSSATELDAELINNIILKKHILKHTPFDWNKKRLKAYKKTVSKGLGAAVGLKRKKTAAEVNLTDPEARKHFESFIQRKDMYGHRTNNAEEVLRTGALTSALEALRRGKLKSYEAGSSVGTHQNLTHEDLPPEARAELVKHLLREDPSASAYVDVGKKHQRDPEDVKRQFIRQEYATIKKFLQAHPAAETFRMKHLSIPKLSPNIFVTQGGVLDEPAYGDTSVLLRNRSARPSPYLNLITDEHIIPSKRPMDPRRASINSGYVIAPKAKIDALSKLNPNVRMVAEEEIPEELKRRLYKPTRSLSEITDRILPAALRGDLSISQTR